MAGEGRTRSSRRTLRRKVIEDPLEVSDDLRQDPDARHRCRASFLATGRRARLPATRPSRQARISLQRTALPVAAIAA
jgi:hypothetical protein